MQHPKREKQKPLLIHLPKAYIEDLDQLVDANFYPNRNEAIRVAVRDLLKTELWRTN